MNFLSFFYSVEQNPSLDIQIRRRDTTLYQQQLSPFHQFNIGRSSFNPFSIDTPSLPMQHFTLVYFHETGPLVQFTSTMGGFLRKYKSFVTLNELKEMPHVHPTLHGYRLRLELGASLLLHLDQIDICICWSYERQNPHKMSPILPLNWLSSKYSSAHLQILPPFRVDQHLENF